MKNISLLNMISEDFRCNSHIKSKLILFLYRTAHCSGTSSSNLITKLFGPYRFFYRFIVDWVLGVDIPWKVRIGRRLTMYHSFALVINEGVELGDDCILRHSVTIGNKLFGEQESLAPRIGNRVEFGAGCIVIGDLQVGDGAIIGAGAIVTKDVDAGMIMIGNPAKAIERKYERH